MSIHEEMYVIDTKKFRGSEGIIGKISCEMPLPLKEHCSVYIWWPSIVKIVQICMPSQQFNTDCLEASDYPTFSMGLPLKVSSGSFLNRPNHSALISS